MRWSKRLPNLVKVSVTRASLPSTVSRKVMTQAARRPGSQAPCENHQSAAKTSTRLAEVTMLGVMPRAAQARTTWKAGNGQTCLVTKSVTPL